MILGGGPYVTRRTTYGTVDDGPAGLTMTAILDPGGPSMAKKMPQMVRETNFWGTIGGMIDYIPCILFRQYHTINWDYQ